MNGRRGVGPAAYKADREAKQEAARREEEATREKAKREEAAKTEAQGIMSQMK